MNKIREKSQKSEKMVKNWINQSILKKRLKHLKTLENHTKIQSTNCTIPRGRVREAKPTEPCTVTNHLSISDDTTSQSHTHTIPFPASKN